MTASLTHRREQFERDGYIIADASVSHILRDVRPRELNRRAGARHLLSDSNVGELARSQTLLDVAATLLDCTNPIPFRATMFAKTGRANWLVAMHQDTVLPMAKPTDDPAWGPWSTKAGIAHAGSPARVLEQIIALRVHLDPSQRDNGPLRVIPRSHSRGVLTSNAIRQLQHERPPAPVLVDRGGILAMRPLLVHGSSKCTNDQSRRVLHIEYAPQLVWPSSDPKREPAHLAVG